MQKFAAVLDTTVEELISGYAPVAPQAVPATEEENGRRSRHIAVILAGGKSGRNRQNIPSQFINVKGKPILVYCMEAYQSHPAIDDVYVVCLRGWENIVEAYAAQYGISKLRGIIPGGSSGILSLKNAVDSIRDSYSPDDFMIIQESTRPLVSPETVSRLLQAGAEKGSATLCHFMNDYVQFTLTDDRPKYVNRDSIIALQSPEAHRFSLLIEMFEKAKARQYPLTDTCCTMTLYNLGYNINFIQSSINNIKISRDEDIAAFSTLIKNSTYL